MSAYSDLILSRSGAVAYWRLDDASGTTAADFSGNGRPATYSTTGVTRGVASLLASDPDAAITLNGSSGYVDCGNASALAIGSSWSFECWFRCPTSAGGAQQQLYGQWASTSFVGRLFVYSGSVYLQLRSTSGADIFNGGSINSAVTAGTVYHIVATWSGTVGCIYLNGVMAATQTRPSQSVLSPASHWYIGLKEDSGDHFAGQIDEAVSYSRPLTAAEILANYTAGSTAGGLLLRRRRCA